MTPIPAPRIVASHLAPGDRVREPYNRPARVVERVWREPGVDKLVCVAVPGTVLFLEPGRRVLRG